MAWTDSLARWAESLEAVDRPAGWLSPIVTRLTHRPPRAPILAGTWLGHPLHPVLTDVPIGCWTSAVVLDLLGGAGSRKAAQRLIGLGVVAALPTAATGMADWGDTVGTTRRVGSVHAILNGTGLVLFALSWRRRHRGHHATGVLLALAGSGAATLAGALGGELVYRRGIGVDTNVFEEGPSELTAATWAMPAEAGGYVLAAEGSKVLAVTGAGGWTGIAGRCSHRGGPLDEGTIRNGCVECPWHHSVFRLDDGSVVTGPATAPQPTYDVKADAGSYWFRRRSAKVAPPA